MQHSVLTFNQVYVLGNLLVLEKINFEEKQKKVRPSKKRKKEFQKIQASLKRIEEGNYSPCLLCGKQMSYAFLLKNPSHDHCMSCQNSRKDELAA